MVAMNVWPTDASDGSVATEARWRKMGRWWMPTGVVTSLAPSLTFPNLTVQAGAAWVDGHYCELLGSQVLAVTANGIAVVRFDPAANTAELVYRDGVTTPAQSPTGTYELLIARIIGSVLTDCRALILADGTLAFPSLAARSYAWPTPPDGARCSVGAIQFGAFGGVWRATGGANGVYKANPSLNHTVAAATWPNGAPISGMAATVAATGDEMYRVDWMLPLNTAGGLGMIGLQRDGIVTVSPSYYQVGAGGYVTGFAIDQPPGGSPMYQLQLYGQVGGPAVIMQGFGWMTISPTNLVSQ